MLKKTLSGLAPMLAIAALAVIPMAAQAATAPRILQNGSEAKLENGKLLPVMAWGTLTLENSKLGLIKCKNAFGGVATDPGTAGSGLAGEAKVSGFTAYECKAAGCELAGEPTEVTTLGQAANPVTKAKETVGRITTPWEAKLTEPAPNAWTLKIGNKTKESPTQMRLAVSCAAQALKAEFTGELNIGGENGQLIGAAPAVLTFKGAESGELESAIGSGTVTGKVKLLGYEAQEVISVVNQ